MGSTGWSKVTLAALCAAAAAIEGVGPFAPGANAQSAGASSRVQVWNASVLAPHRDLVPGNPNEPLQPIALVGTRNGSFSGKVVVGSTAPIRGLRAQVGDLAERGGPGRIPSKAVHVRYAMRSSNWGTWQVVPEAISRFDDLYEKCPDEVPVVGKVNGADWIQGGWAVVPVWVTVRVPADARPGEYEGKLVISAGADKLADVPVKLTVCSWKLPDPREYCTFVDMMQSPDSVSLEYDAPLWSEKHWKLMENSFKHAGEIGSRVVYVPLICRTNMGNAESMVRWVKKADGTWGHDFSIMDRYLDLAEKHIGKPQIVCFYVWDAYLEGGMTAAEEPATLAARKEHEGKGPLVTALPAGGGTETVTLPPYSDGASAALWKPLLRELDRRLKKRGIEKAAMFGIATDVLPAREVVTFFNGLRPGTNWVKHAHNPGLDLYGVPYGYCACFFHMDFWLDPDARDGTHNSHNYGWRRPELVAFYSRAMSENSPITGFRLTAEMNISGTQRGLGRLGGDFWVVLKDRRGTKVGRVSERYPLSSWRNLNIHMSILSPGPDGAVATARFEMLREGIQETEARILIEKALTDDALRARMGDKLADRCRALILERQLACLRGLGIQPKTQKYGYIGDGSAQFGKEGYLWFAESGWQERSRKLFEAASEVAGKTGVK